MVFEQLYPPRLLLVRPWFAFLMGIGYSIIGIAIALFLFPRDPALLAVALTSILFMPSLAQLSSLAEKTERTKTGLFKAVMPFIRVYLAAFFGIFVTFVFFAITLSKLTTSILFKSQLDLLIGHATFSLSLFGQIFANNFGVFLLCFIISLMVGNGAIFLICWNASVWGTIFGNLARTAAEQISGNPIVLVGIILTAVIPHVFLEILAYIMAVAAGSVLSEAIVRERIDSPQFTRIVKRNMLLLFIGFIVLVVGGLVETFVLNNVEVYAQIARIAFS